MIALTYDRQFCCRMIEVVCLAVCVWIVFVASAYAQTSILIVAEKSFYISDGELKGIEGGALALLLQVGIGFDGTEKRNMRTYLQFDLSEIPASTIFHNVSIDSGKLRMLAQSIVLASIYDQFFVTVTSCREAAWPEETVTADSRICADQGESQDSIVVEGENLPGIYAWDVTRGIESARQEGHEKLAMVVEGFLLPNETGGAREIVPGERFGPKGEVGFVHFWSTERVEFEVNGVPTLAISHSTHLITLEAPEFRVCGFIGTRSRRRTLRVHQ